MILVVTNEDDPHADAVISHLKSNAVFRLNTETLLSESNLFFLLDKKQHRTEFSAYNTHFTDLSAIKCVYYRRPLKPKSETSDLSEIIIDEAWGALYHALNSLTNIKWLGHPHFDKINSSRILQLTKAKQIGFDVPETIISNDSKKIIAFCKQFEHVIVKPLQARGIVENEIWTPYFSEKLNSKDLFNYSSELSSTYNYIQRYIPKKREWRVTIVGKDIFPCVIDSQKTNSDLAKADWRKVKSESIPHYYEGLPREVEAKIHKYMSDLGMSFGAMDLIEGKDGNWYFLECNPNGQWLWIEELTEQPIAKTIAKWLST
jgi:glutathione synthase/RimK-type ligase-like ATP-grasp enzyme